MQDKGTSFLARAAAVGGLIVLFVAVIAVIAVSSGGDDGGGDEETTVKDSGPDITSTRQSAKEEREIEVALDRGEYVVQPGDSLVSIAEATGIDVETLEQLNPGIDPQALQEGARVRLR